MAAILSIINQKGYLQLLERGKGRVVAGLKLINFNSQPLLDLIEVIAQIIVLSRPLRRIFST
jgi:hypothetical protein